MLTIYWFGHSIHNSYRKEIQVGHKLRFQLTLPEAPYFVPLLLTTSSFCPSGLSRGGKTPARHFSTSPSSVSTAELHVYAKAFMPRSAQTNQCL